MQSYSQLMSFDSSAIDTVTVDSYGTLVDPTSIHSKLSDYVENPVAVSNLWFRRSLLNKLVANFIGVYEPFDVLSEDSLNYALSDRGITLSDKEKKEILAAYNQLDVYPEVKEGMERIEGKGYDIYVISNGTPSMLETLTNHVGVKDLVEDTISTHEIKTYKPDAKVYRHAAARTGTPINRTIHVSGPYFDVLGAMHAGMQGAWINYGDGPRDTFAGGPSIEVSSFNDLADRLPKNK